MNCSPACEAKDMTVFNQFLNTINIDTSIPLNNREQEDAAMRQSIRDVLKNTDGLVMGGNDFLYTKDLPSHPCSYFLYHYGHILVEEGVDTIFLENHYIKEPIQTRGLIGHVMYCAYLYKLRVIGLEGKFTPEEYFKHTNKKIDAPWTTVAFATKKRLDRLNIITKDIVDHYKIGKYLLFCGMSHVNDETEVTECKGIKNLLNVYGCGASFSDSSRIIPNEPFRDERSMYQRPTDYMIYIYRNPTVDNRLYLDATIWCFLHDFLFFYKTYRNLMKAFNLPFSVKLLWNHDTILFPDNYVLYVKDMIERDPQLDMPESEYKDVCSFVFSQMSMRKTMPSRDELVKAFASFTDQHMYDIVDKWVKWLKKLVSKKKLNRVGLDACSDIIFLDNKQLSLDDDEDKYITYLHNKFVKQMDRPEHKLYNLCYLMKLFDIMIPTNNILERLLTCVVCVTPNSEI